MFTLKKGKKPSGEQQRRMDRRIDAVCTEGSVTELKHIQ